MTKPQTDPMTRALLQALVCALVDARMDLDMDTMRNARIVCETTAVAIQCDMLDELARACHAFVDANAWTWRAR